MNAFKAFDEAFSGTECDAFQADVLGFHFLPVVHRVGGADAEAEGADAVEGHRLAHGKGIDELLLEADDDSLDVGWRERTVEADVLCHLV